MSKNQPKTDAEALSVEGRDAADGLAQLIHRIASHVGQHTHVRSAFGEPVSRDDVTVIPLANIYGGFGGGGGAGAGEHPEHPEHAATDEAQAHRGKGGGLGGGGGFVVQPCGVFEVSSRGVRFRRASRPGLLASIVELVTSLVRAA